jgi:hypothetical protein
MRLRLLSLAIASTALLSGAEAQEVRTVSRSEPIRALYKPASEGIGYSVLYQPPGGAAQSYRVKVVCTFDQVSATAQCPSVDYYAFCPSAQIVCR